MRWRGCSYFCMGLERQYMISNFGLKAEICWLQQAKRDPLVTQAKGKDPLVSQTKGRDPLVTQENLCVFSSRRTTSQKGSLPQKKDMCELSLHSYFTQTSLSKNKNINYIFIYLRVFCCLSSSAIHYTKYYLNYLQHEQLKFSFG